MARSTIRTAVTVALAAGIAGATAAVAAPAPAHGHGALKATLFPKTSTLSQCDAATSGASKGFAVLNAPGKPGGAPSRVVGTVSLKKAAETNTAFEVDLAVGGTCQNTGSTLTTNGVGNGTASFSVALPADNTDTEFYVVLKKAPANPLAALPVQLPIPVAMSEAYASKAVTLS